MQQAVGTFQNLPGPPIQFVSPSFQRPKFSDKKALKKTNKKSSNLWTIARTGFVTP